MAVCSILTNVGEMPVQQQVKLLRVLQDKRIRPVGGNREVNLDFKIIAATNRDLRDAVRSGRFRDDLYYRLNVLSSCSCRRCVSDWMDIGAIARYYLERYCEQYGVAPEVRELYAAIGGSF